MVGGLAYGIWKLKRRSRGAGNERAFEAARAD
jgi:hypothetical protein